MRSGLARSTLGIAMRSGGAASAFDPLSVFGGGTYDGFYYDFTRPLTDATADGLKWLYQDNEDAVSADAQSVGIALDRSQGASLGDDLVTNGGFDANVSGWNAGGSATIAWSSGEMEVDVSGASGGFATASALSGETGAIYEVKIRVRKGTYTGSFNFSFSSSAVSITPTVEPVDHTFYFRSASSSPSISAARSGTPTGTYYVDDVSVRKVAGNHGYQGTAAAKPTYDEDGFLSFDAGDYLDTGLAPTSAATMVVCFRNSANGNTKTLVGGVSAGGTRLGVGKAGNKLVGLYGNHNGLTIVGTTTLTAGGYYVGTFRSDGSTNVLRLNGEVEYSAAASGSPNPLLLFLGAYNNNGSAAELWDDRIYHALAVKTDVDDATLLKLERALGAGIVSF